ncbi:hypothetical protein SeLEV6574_g01152 [Synchytrium endobioticum]|nr:hypothetical protein SeLEV6574_g01152 [Synchytrium endobioticum]
MGCELPLPRFISKRYQNTVRLVLVLLTAYFSIPATPPTSPVSRSGTSTVNKHTIVEKKEYLEWEQQQHDDAPDEPLSPQCLDFYPGEWRGPAMSDNVCFYPHHPCRDLKKHPIQVWPGAWGHGDGPDGCPVPFVFATDPSYADVSLTVIPGDAANPKVGKCQRSSVFAVESAANYPLIEAAKKTHDIVSTYEIYHADNPIPYTYNFLDFTKQPLPTSEKSMDKVGALVASFVSNCAAQNDRNQRMKELGELIPVHQFGPCMNNANPMQSTHRWNDKMVELQRHKFTLAYENSHATDYVTEKLFQPLEVGSVPLVYGALNARDFVPKGPFPSAIFIEDFKTTKDLARYLKYLDSNDTAYEEYLEWKRHPLPTEFVRLQEPYRLNCVCRLAMLLAGKWRNPNLNKDVVGWTPDKIAGNPRDIGAGRRNSKGHRKVSLDVKG